MITYPWKNARRESDIIVVLSMSLSAKLLHTNTNMLSPSAMHVHMTVSLEIRQRLPADVEVTILGELGSPKRIVVHPTATHSNNPQRIDGKRAAPTVGPSRAMLIACTQ